MTADEHDAAATTEAVTAEAVTAASADRALPRNVIVLSWVSFFQDAASEMLYPVLPLFVTGVLGAAPAALGLIEGVAEATAAGTKAIAGNLADRTDRKPMITAGYGISAFSKPVIGLAGGWPLVLVARFGDRVGKGLRGAPRDAMIADDTPPALRGKAFGVHRAADTAGAVVGPLLGLAMYFALGHRLRPLFFLAAIPALVSVFLTRFVRETPSAHRRPHHLDPAPPGPFGSKYWGALLILGVFALVNFSDALLLLRASELGLGFVGVVLAYTLYNAVYAALSVPAGLLSDRVSRPLVVAMGLAVFAVAYLGLGLVTTSGWVWILLPTYGMYTAMTDGVGKAWLADVLPKSHRGRGMGYFQAVTGAAALGAGIWAGLAWHGNGRLPLLVSGGVALVLAVVLAAVAPRLDARVSA